MTLVVQKYGGSSVAGVARMQAVAERVAATVAGGAQVVVVVSAMGDTTDELIALAEALHPDPAHREMDLLMSTGETVSCALLALALHAAGVPARALTGAQAGIYTDGAHRRAAIVQVDPRRVREDAGRGRGRHRGRVPGRARGRPRRRGHHAGQGRLGYVRRGSGDWPGRRLLRDLYRRGRRLYRRPARGTRRAAHSAHRLHGDARTGPAGRPRDALARRELGSLYNLPIVVRSSFHLGRGTVIAAPDALLPPQLALEGDPMERDNKICGVARDRNVARVTVRGLPHAHLELHQVFTPLADAGINVDAIAYALDADGHTADCSFTVAESDLARTVQVAGTVAVELGAREIRTRRDVAKVSLVGVGVEDTPGLAARAFAVLAQAGIPIEMVTTSQIRITCLVPQSRMEDAVHLLHHAFHLDAGRPAAGARRPAQRADSLP